MLNNASSMNLWAPEKYFIILFFHFPLNYSTFSVLPERKVKPTNNVLTCHPLNQEERA